MNIELIMSVILGVGLAAACGFRVFVPLFATSLFTHFGLDGAAIADGFEWLSSIPAILTFGVASLVEIFAYYIPFVDNLLDTVAVPLAGVAGTLVSFSTMMDMDPLLQWSIALIAGGGLAGLIKGSAAGTRALSSVSSGGLGNPVVSTAETGGSLLLTGLAWFIPPLAIALVLIILFFILRFLFRRLRRS